MEMADAVMSLPPCRCGVVRLDASALRIICRHCGASTGQCQDMDEATRRWVAMMQPEALRHRLRPMSEAPRDGTIIVLWVKGDDHPWDEADGEAQPTIGCNLQEHTGEDTWQVAGWDWCADRICQGTGQPVGWLPAPLIEGGKSDGPA